MPALAPAAPAGAAASSLTALDRCDARDCGAQARAVAHLPGGGRLLFCRHHAEANRSALAASGADLDTHYDGLAA